MSKLVHITIQTSRFEEEIEFYEKEAGLTLQRDLRPKKDIVFLADAAGDTCVEVIRNPEADQSGSPNISIGFQADDVEKKAKENAAVAGILFDKIENQFIPLRAFLSRFQFFWKIRQHIADQ